MRNHIKKLKLGLVLALLLVIQWATSAQSAQIISSVQQAPNRNATNKSASIRQSRNSSQHHIKANQLLNLCLSNDTGVGPDSVLSTDKFYSLKSTITKESTSNLQTVFEGEHEHLSCPIDSAIAKRHEVDLSPKCEHILRLEVQKKVDFIWLKNDKPFHRRENGNPVANGDPFSPSENGSPKGDEKVKTLIGVDPTDSGMYTCLINYTQVPSEIRKRFDLSPSITFLLHVEPRAAALPDSKPAITHHPSDQIVDRGSNATFNCNSIITLSSPTTYWFKACAHEQFNNQSCVEEFHDNYRKVEEGAKTDLLIQYILTGENSNTYHIHNASDKDIAIYGCWVENTRGLDIRYAQLNLIDKLIESRASSTLTSSNLITITTTLTPPPTVSSESGRTKLYVDRLNQNPNNHNQTISSANYVSMFPHVAVAESRESHGVVWWAIGSVASVVLLFIPVSICLFCALKRQIRKDKKKSQNIIPSPIVGSDWLGSDNLRQAITAKDTLNNYSIGKTADGFICGHLHQVTGQVLSQSICSRALDKEKNPSISSSNSNSDEASSLGKSVSTSSNGDNSRLFYLHTSNTTSTTVPLYDHPPSTGKSHQFAIIQDACVINPTYGFLRFDTTTNEWAFPRRNLEKLNKIGEGQFGEVWRYIARQKDGSESVVAVKQLKDRAGLGDRERLELIAEIEIMKSVNDHPNVIKLLNYCIDEYEPILVIMEWAEHGKLQTYLRDCRTWRKAYGYPNQDNQIVTSRELIKFSYHITKGMEYVASKGIIHRDLASRNILVSVDKVCKVADFGFARRVSDDSAYERSTGNPVPIKWMAPEALAENKFTSKSDVFSLGILMWEIVTLGGTPYENLTSPDVVKKVTSGGRLEKPAHCKEEFFDIMSQCWLHDPAKRPTFKEIALQLEGLLLSENDYIQLDQYPEHAYYNILTTEDKEIAHHDMVT